jgi:hypothetical protein
MVPNPSRLLSLGVAAALMAACGSGGSGGYSTTSSTSSTSSTDSTSSTGSSPIMPAARSGNASILISDASAEDWATIGVKVLSIALVPQRGGSTVRVHTTPTTVPLVNLAQLDQIADILGTARVPVGTYTGAVLTISANAGGVPLMVASNPELRFIETPETTIPTDRIQVQHTEGTVPNLTASLKVTFVEPLVVTAPGV